MGAETHLKAGENANRKHSSWYGSAKRIPAILQGTIHLQTGRLPVPEGST